MTLTFSIIGTMKPQRHLLSSKGTKCCRQSLLRERTVYSKDDTIQYNTKCVIHDMFMDQRLLTDGGVDPCIFPFPVLPHCSLLPWWVRFVFRIVFVSVTTSIGVETRVGHFPDLFRQPVNNYCRLSAWVSHATKYKSPVSSTPLKYLLVVFLCMVPFSHLWKLHVKSFSKDLCMKKDKTFGVGYFTTISGHF